MSHYPFEWQVQDICAADFDHFENQFSQTILQFIPFAAGPVTFMAPGANLLESLNELNKPKYWLKYIKRVFRRQSPVLASESPVLFLPVWHSASIVGIAAIEGIEKKFADVLAEEWLADRSRIISREFFLLKQQAVDPVTGLLNGRYLHDRLNDLLLMARETSGYGVKRAVLEHLSLLMIEIHPRANNAAKALNYIVRAGYHLESFLGQHVVYHLGNGIFGIIGENVDEEQSQKLGKNILRWFRRDGFHRIHIGINTIELKSDTKSDDAENWPASQAVIEQTWQTLRQAARRGPYALCTYSSISKADTHPLKKTKSAVLAKLRKLWADIDTFAILLISQDRKLQGEVFSKRLLALIEPGAKAVPINESEIFVLLENAAEKNALTWARNLKKKLPHDMGATYSIGIACFPCIDFKKSDVPQNARKALLHAGFFGPDTLVAFDGISQNISGDIFYSEGDLVRAVGEYKNGLDMDPANVNLLNSLGESYAQMNKSKRAEPFFEAVLRLDPKHYMALFNLGIISLTNAENEKASEYFEQALSVSKHKPEVNQKNELILQLGRLYCIDGRYKKAVTLLEREKLMDETGTFTPSRNAMLRYLGEAYKGCGRNKEAIAVMQRAIRYNRHDDNTLSMLGELYALENQSDDIALSLCLQAVNIDDRKWKHWYRLALVRYKMGNYESALEDLKESMSRKRKNEKILYFAGQVYDKLGEQAKAAAMYKAVLKIAPDHKGVPAAFPKIK